jgi:hypothetical protein
MSEMFGKAQRHAPGSGKSIDQSEPHTLACLFTIRPEFVVTLFFTDKTVIVSVLYFMMVDFISFRIPDCPHVQLSGGAMGQSAAQRPS